MTNSKGHLVPVDAVKPLDRLRDGLVAGVMGRAKGLRDDLVDFKADVMAEIKAFVELSANEYDVEMGGVKGNITLRSYDGLREIRVQVADRLVFDERLKVAERLVGQCLADWSADARPELKVIVDRAFKTDKDGNVNTAAVLDLRRLDIADTRWKKAMEAIADALTVTGTKSYVRFYERSAPDAPLQAISLDLARL
jgi:hypothetical protein